MRSRWRDREDGGGRERKDLLTEFENDERTTQHRCPMCGRLRICSLQQAVLNESSDKFDRGNDGGLARPNFLVLGPLGDPPMILFPCRSGDIGLRSLRSRKIRVACRMPASCSEQPHQEVGDLLLVACRPCRVRPRARLFGIYHPFRGYLMLELKEHCVGT